ncbi:hypothetical protein BU15DRAFT_81763 [Melanogaster broomeanus]|nr:hypothetical protein BU15DRAFT_81763 [Melanogaster broomeanus]
MDVLAAAATIIQLLQVTAQVSTALGQYVAAVQGAESSRSKLLDQITLISTAGRAIESVVLNSPPSSRTPEQQAFLTEWFRSDGSPARCKKELDDLLIWLHSQAGDKKNTRFIKRLMWPLKENRIQTAIKVIQEHMPYFYYILSIDTSNRIQEVTSIITSEREHTAKRKLLEWLDGVDCTVKHESTREQRQRTTGEWLFNEDLYIEWRKCSFGLLWLSGKAGAGKSVLAYVFLSALSEAYAHSSRSAVIDSLSSGLADDETLASFYCDFRTPRSTHTMEILRSLTTQLLWNSKIDWLSSFPELVMRKERGTGPPVDITTLSDLLGRAAKLHQRPMIVIDALDECEDLSKLLGELVKLDKACRLFVTSRPLHSINGAFGGLPSISLNDKIDAVRSDMHFHISTELESRDRLKILSHDLQVEIRDALLKKADGMFRWVQCQLNRLNGCWSLGDLREVLDTLPATLYETYERMLRAIDKKEFGGRVARRALVWLVTALNSLTLSELADALNVSRDNPASDSTFATMHETDIVEICGSLVSFDERTRRITLSHYSVKEYLASDIVADKTYFVHDARANFELASVSIYSIMLSIDELNVGSRGVSSYAMRTGLSHLANCATEGDDLLVELLLIFQNHVSNYRRSYATRWRHHIWITTVSQLALYTIIRFGHVSMLRHYLDHHSVQVTQGANPLGLDVNVEAIVPIDPGDMPSLPPLIAATRNHKYQEELVTMLLARESTVPRNAIHSVFRGNAIGDCKPFTIQILLQHGADVMLSEAGGESCLHLLLQPRYADPEHINNVFKIARLLVEAGGDPAALDDLGLSPTHLALSGGYFQLVEWLVENGFRLPPDAVLHAVQCRHSATLLPMLHLLFESGVVADVRDDFGCNALHILLQDHSDATEEAIKLLLKQAARSTTLHVVEFLIHHGAQLPHDIVNCVAGNFFWRGGSAMSLLIRLVTIHGASCQARTTHGDNALHCPLSTSYDHWHCLVPDEREPIEELLFLLEKGCDFHATGSSGLTVFATAIEHGYLSISRILLNRFTPPHADIALEESDSGDAQGNTFLHRLCYRLEIGDSVTNINFIHRVNLLQEAGFDLRRYANTPNNAGYTPLYIILQCRKPRPVIVSYLLHFGAKFSDVNPLFLDNLEWASELSWYSDASEAYQRKFAQPKITFDDVDRVYHLLVDRCKLPVPAVRRIMDTAEYWAHTRALIENPNIQSILIYGCEPIASLAVPFSETLYWTPCRVVFSCKLRAIDHGTIQLSICRQNVVYNVPVYLRVESVPLVPPRTVFGVWDDYTAAEQLDGGQQMAVKDLTCGDTLRLALIPDVDASGRVELEFFQIDMYFTMRATDDSPSLNESH